MTAKIPPLTSFAVLSVTRGSAVNVYIRVGSFPITVVIPGYRTVSSAAACKEKLTAGPCHAQRWTVNSVSSPRMSAAHAVSLTPAKQTPFAMTSLKHVWMKPMSFASLDLLGLSMAQSAPSASARMAMSVAQWIHSAFRNCDTQQLSLTSSFWIKNFPSQK